MPTMPAGALGALPEGAVARFMYPSAGGNAEAYLLRDRLANLSKPHRLVLFPEHGHRLPMREIKDHAVEFLKETGGSACAVSDR